MTISIKSPGDMISLIMNAIQASAAVTVDTTPGSITLAYGEGNLGLGLFLQQLFVQVEALTRLKTSQGNDKVTFGNDFNFSTSPAAPSSGNCTFSRTSATTQAFVKVGSTVQTSDATAQFTVVADSTNSDYDPSLKAYVMDVSDFSVSAKVECTEPGTTGNVLANAITVITSPINGVSSVTNLLAFTNGESVPEGDLYDQQFYLYLAGLQSGTVVAIQGAIERIQANVDCHIIENEDHDGNSDPGNLTIIVDDGSGDPPDSLLNSAFNVAEAVHAGGILFAVFPPTQVPATIVAQIILADGADPDEAIADAVLAITEYFSSTLKISIPLYYSRLTNLIYNASDSIIDVLNVTLNGTTANLTAEETEKILLAAPPSITVV